MTTFTATVESVGEWDGQESEAVECWNKYISPALCECYGRMETDCGEEGENYGYVAQHAWEMFCDTTDEESFRALGQRVASWVQQQ